MLLTISKLEEGRDTPPIGTVAFLAIVCLLVLSVDSGRQKANKGICSFLPELFGAFWEPFKPWGLMPLSGLELANSLWHVSANVDSGGELPGREWLGDRGPPHGPSPVRSFCPALMMSANVNTPATLSMEILWHSLSIETLLDHSIESHIYVPSVCQCCTRSWGFAVGIYWIWTRALVSDCSKFQL